MIKCKLCNNEYRNILSFNVHLKTHKIKLLEYFIKFESFKIPKCPSCNKKCQNQQGLKFNNTCGDKDCIKKVLRIKRLKFMKENPEKTAWRLKNMSYPEKVFKETFERMEHAKEFLLVRERPVFPYFIDYAFENEKVAVEIDGKQHELEERKKSDLKKDKHLMENNWRVFRIKASQLLSNPELAIKEVLSFVGNSKLKGKSGIVTYKEIKPKKEKNIFGFTDLQVKNQKKQRKADRPNFNILITEIKELGYVKTGQKYGVSDNAIRKWIKMYNKHGENF